jgi:hypothetical protein
VHDELVDFYERYIAAFNARDRAGFASFFHLPVTVVPPTRYDERRSGRSLPQITDAETLWAPLPGHWARSTIDAVVPLSDAAPFVAHDGLVGRDDFRPAVLATVTRRRADDSPYEHLHVLYLLTREDGRLGIKVMIELAAAMAPRSGEAVGS